MKHLNSNILCVIAIKTTGSNAQKHELLEIAIIPLDFKCNISKDIMPYNVILKPENIDRAEYNLDNDLVLKCVEQGMDKYEAADLFEAWFAKLQLPPRKKIMVLTHNWAAKIDFIREWLQPTSFDMCFSHEYRDIQAVGLYLNDRDDVRNERYSFPKVKLSYMGAVLRVEYEDRLPTVIDECQCIINIYKELVNH
jgi:hypothetical protein